MAFYIFLSFVFGNCMKDQYQSETVDFRNGSVKFKGTLYKPLSAAPYPVIVLAHGSGKVTEARFIILLTVNIFQKMVLPF